MFEEDSRGMAFPLGPLPLSTWQSWHSPEPMQHFRLQLPEVSLPTLLLYAFRESWGREVYSVTAQCYCLDFSIYAAHPASSQIRSPWEQVCAHKLLFQPNSCRPVPSWEQT